MSSEKKLEKNHSVDYLYSSSHSICFNAALSNSYIQNFYDYCDTNKINLPDQLQFKDSQNAKHLRFCANCNNIYLPGVNVTIRVKFDKANPKIKNRIRQNKQTKQTKQTKQPESNVKVQSNQIIGKWKPRKRVLSYKCTLCNHELLIPLLTPTSQKKTNFIKENPLKSKNTSKDPRVYNNSNSNKNIDENSKNAPFTDKNIHLDSKSLTKKKRKKQKHSLIDIIQNKKSKNQKSLEMSDFFM
ncbi:ribonuclease P Rpr2/Rpp21/SNM1 subunit ASCRUDRAFT_69452 [Ascoidea rubescens DSM 1968]|uniref:Rpr2-domain-containing protein n=1 Tax=Ascoidea rubescens DSM 1968 TaxID=1344418 RepID=A0A1D2VGL0_9ASCO|nr:hypothetical protein ASCRUDRAFT_86303 [Ascoidea rubescens DSM 1968]XP_020048985.1 hypothetical protein ASCRUDRAFT_69452 [Ascoidea rubescens DSM 1968]ODV60633.1 hypothetical protein ASCRUDRAFT_86303 [Ascoidea rubescens DSM 1968]ODV62678.1 hypothetical protein ASCRUDRAFT_69452 [Ascoidea rubescens DSM 1968]